MAVARRRQSHTGKVLSRETMFVDGLEVRLTRKQIRSMRMRISRDGLAVEMSAPPTATIDGIQRFVRSKREWIDAAMAKAADSPSVRAERATDAEVAEWRKVVKACVPPLVAAWEPIMGVKAGELAYRNMRSRWGSCQPATGRICVNTRLALYPPECLEYVVVHELAHLIVPGHGKEFHKVMDTFMPDWRIRQAKLQR